MFEVADIPKSLWDPAHIHGQINVPKGIFRLPTRLEQAYQQILNELGLMAMASVIENNPDSGPIGEEGEAGAREHFAKRFSGSCGRIQLFVLDPHHTFKTTRQTFATTFSGGKIRLLDIPLGAGAAAVEILSLVCQLRSEEPSVFPRIDLDVEIVGGELNAHAMAISNKLFERLRPWWRENAINASLKTVVWDVMDDTSNYDLVELWKGGIVENVVPMVIGANFSGFMGQASPQGHGRYQIDEAETCLRHIFVTASRFKARTFWIEPVTRHATVRFLPKLRTKVFARYTNLHPGLPNEPQSAARLHHPIIAGAEFTTRATGIHLQPAP